MPTALEALLKRWDRLPSEIFLIISDSSQGSPPKETLKLRSIIKPINNEVAKANMLRISINCWKPPATFLASGVRIWFRVS